MSFLGAMWSGLIRAEHQLERALGLHPALDTSASSSGSSGASAPRPAGSPLRPGVREGFPALVTRFEGRVPTMYRDVKGLVTTGIGNLIDPTDLALSLPWLHANGTPATADEIQTEWQRVKALPFGPTHAAPSFAAPSGLHLSDDAIDALVLRHLDGDAAQLARTFPQFPQWPAQAQTAALRMAWALGAGFPGKWPAWSDAARAQDWTRAAAASPITGLGTDASNAAVASLFHEAANDPHMAGTGPIPQASVTPAMSAFAVELLHRGPVAFPIGNCETRDFDGVTVRGCAERHTWIGKTGEQRPQGLRGISLYYGSPSPAGGAQTSPPGADVPMGGLREWFAALVEDEHGIERWLGLRPAQGEEHPLSVLLGSARHEDPGPLSRVRQDILAAVDGVMGIAWPSDAYKAFDPGYRPDDPAWRQGLTDKGYDPDKVTECGRLPGYAASKARLAKPFQANGLAGLRDAAQAAGVWVPWSPNARPLPADFLIYGNRANGSISHTDVMVEDRGSTFRVGAAGQGGHPNQATAYLIRAYDAQAGTLGAPAGISAPPRDLLGWVDVGRAPREDDARIAGVDRDSPGVVLAALLEAS